jgi:hypothetical protein
VTVQRRYWVYCKDRGTLEVDAGVKVMWVVRGQLPRRGRRRRTVVGATRVAFSGRGESRERLTGEWRALLDVENMEMQRRARGNRTYRDHLT